MRFERIRIHNFKCHEAADVTFDPGVTVVHGVNGSGKSSLLEACFFGLYGTKALDTTLDEVVTIGADDMAVKLWFTHDGAQYDIERKVSVSGDVGARTRSTVMTGPDGTIERATDVRKEVARLLRMDHEAFLNCAYVRQGEVNKLINASPSVRQDMLDDLLQLGTLESYRDRASEARVGVGRVRDDKQGALAELEDQIEQKEKSKPHERLNESQSELVKVREKIERYESNRKNARETLEQAKSIIDSFEEKREELEGVEEDVETVRDRIQSTTTERKRIEERIESHRVTRESARERSQELCKQVEGIGSTIEEDEEEEEEGGEDTPNLENRDRLAELVEAELKSVRSEQEAITEKIKDVSVAIQEHESERKALVEAAETNETVASEKRERADGLEAELEETLQAIEAKRAALARIREKLQGKQSAFEEVSISVGRASAHRESVAESLSECRQRRAELETKRESDQERLEEAESLREAGQCPECGQPVEESPHVHAIDGRKERIEELTKAITTTREEEAELEKRLANAEELVEREAAIDRLENERENVLVLLGEQARPIREKHTRIERLRAEAESAKTTAAEKRNAADRAGEDVAERKERIAELNQKQSAHSERKESLQTLVEVLDELDDLTEELERLRNQREEKREVNDERRERLERLRNRRDKLADSIDEDRIDDARDKREEAEAYLSEVEQTLEELETRKSAVQGRIGAIENELKELESLRERRETVETTVDHLESLYSEANQLQELYGRLRTELRKQNVVSLERLLNETFDLVYESDTYARIELDGEYRLTVYQKDGKPLDPEQLSGGERALFNLSLRCAIYRLLAEGIEGTAPMPPLILDEPTVFLDAGHVSQLLELIDTMYDLGVAQVLVVSHDDELVAAADELITVRKDSTTNRASIGRDTLPDQQTLPADD